MKNLSKLRDKFKEGMWTKTPLLMAIDLLLEFSFVENIKVEIDRMGNEITISSPNDIKNLRLEDYIEFDTYQGERIHQLLNCELFLKDCLPIIFYNQKLAAITSSSNLGIGYCNYPMFEEFWPLPGFQDVVGDLPAFLGISPVEIIDTKVYFDSSNSVNDWWENRYED